MKRTTMRKREEIEKNWYIVDAEGKTLGRLASRIASVLRGKNKPSYSPHMDAGDYVIVVNAGKVRVTGNKLVDKKYWRHSGYLGGLTKLSLGEMMRKDPCFPIENAVRGMLPHNKLGKRLQRKLKVYEGSEHPHEAQQPEPLEF